MIEMDKAKVILKLQKSGGQDLNITGKICKGTPETETTKESNRMTLEESNLEEIKDQTDNKTKVNMPIEEIERTDNFKKCLQLDQLEKCISHKIKLRFLKCL